jgi:2-amino-4-hydroxy-6-hydroxymethyldihydropteridine diphosphokinase
LLGSNIQPEWNLPAALHELYRRFHVLRTSRIWESPAVGSDGPNFLNMAVLIQSSLDPHRLKNLLLKPLEEQLGRVRTKDKYAARSIDIDIVTVGDQPLDPGLWKLAYLAVPFAEVFPDLKSPQTGESLIQAALRLKQNTPIRQRRDLHAQLAHGPSRGDYSGIFTIDAVLYDFSQGVQPQRVDRFASRMEGLP